MVPAGFRWRALRKDLITGHVDPLARDEQFRLMAALRRFDRPSGMTVLCIDTKREELLGTWSDRAMLHYRRATRLRLRFSPLGDGRANAPRGL
jgi:hypothetical protein